MQPPGHPPPAGPGDDRGLTISLLHGRIGLRLAGDVDMSNRDQLHSALAALPDTATVHLELSGLRFIDVAGTRELIALVQCEPHPHLVLHDPPSALRRIIALLWPGNDVEIQVSGDGCLRANGSWTAPNGFRPPTGGPGDDLAGPNADGSG